MTHQKTILTTSIIIIIIILESPGSKDHGGYKLRFKTRWYGYLSVLLLLLLLFLIPLGV